MENNRNAYSEIKKLDNFAELLGFEIRESDNLDCYSGSYEDTGNYLDYVINKYPDSFDVIEQTVIAICGKGFESLLDGIKEHKEYCESL